MSNKNLCLFLAATACAWHICRAVPASPETMTCTMAETVCTDSIQQSQSLKGNKNYKEPQFPYGKVACQKWLKSHIQYPAECESKGLEGTVYAQFIVLKDGTIGDITILKSPHPAFSEEVIRLLGEMPKWKPGLLNGQPIRVKYTLPVVFYFEESVNFKTSKKKKA